MIGGLTARVPRIGPPWSSRVGCGLGLWAEEPWVFPQPTCEEMEGHRENRVRVVGMRETEDPSRERKAMGRLEECVIARPDPKTVMANAKARAIRRMAISIWRGLLSKPRISLCGTTPPFNAFINARKRRRMGWWPSRRWRINLRALATTSSGIKCRSNSTRRLHNTGAGGMSWNWGWPNHEI